MNRKEEIKIIIAKLLDVINDLTNNSDYNSVKSIKISKKILEETAKIEKLYNEYYKI